ncbi:hypothetical protein ISN44_As08g035120 [Arabidopsis suecica]|uniref:Uncharacterized protein n=1 Tax=Arabidopsis suecica TaxID=45249 RepID=A0A8T2BA41_ARASU|nr:hypothetical protein ISN44_As08g035120 [Arabidopsis suecica]
MASCDPKGDVVLMMLARTEKNIEELEEILNKVELISNGTGIDVSFASLDHTIFDIERNVKKASEYYSYLKKKKAADYTFVSDEVMDKFMNLDFLSTMLLYCLNIKWTPPISMVIDSCKPENKK